MKVNSMGNEPNGTFITNGTGEKKKEEEEEGGGRSFFGIWMNLWCPKTNVSKTHLVVRNWIFKNTWRGQINFKTYFQAA